jgi:hypothetical protein
MSTDMFVAVSSRSILSSGGSTAPASDNPKKRKRDEFRGQFDDTPTHGTQKRNSCPKQKALHAAMKYEYSRQQSSQELMRLCVDEHTQQKAIWKEIEPKMPKKTAAKKDQDNFSALQKVYQRHEQSYNNRMPDFERRKAAGGPFDFEGHKGTKNAVSTAHSNSISMSSRVCA